jgi:hypothetical protein
MDYRQLFKDIATLNFSAFGTRYHKLLAVLKRRFLLPNDNDSLALNEHKNVPIIINNRNRLTYLKQMINWFIKAGYSNIVILDNNSNYSPLLEYYKSSGLKVIYLKENFGHLALWKSGLYKNYYHNYYVYSDPDLLPIETCPNDFMRYFLETLQRYNNIEKIGFGLKIDDLPNHYSKKNEVIAWEQKFWKEEIEKDVYIAALDTTFAVYKPYTNGALWVQNALRSGGNYVMRHLPWYEDSSNLTEEDAFYKANMKKGASHWIKKDEVDK